MIRVTRTFPVAVDSRRAMEFMKDFSNAEQWDPGTQSCERLDIGEIVEGSRWHNKSKLIFIPTELEYELTDLTDTRVAFRGENKSAVSIDDITIEANGDSSIVTYEANVTFRGAAKIGEPAMRLIFQKLAKDTVEQLTGALEAL